MHCVRRSGSSLFSTLFIKHTGPFSFLEARLDVCRQEENKFRTHLPFRNTKQNIMENAIIRRGMRFPIYAARGIERSRELHARAAKRCVYNQFSPTCLMTSNLVVCCVVTRLERAQIRRLGIFLIYHPVSVNIVA